ncbi:hydrogenase maturation protease [Vulgatibacter incomptus]|uniref:Hydrogenase maturation protease n=1 Tax=Vulgatibacter incomptus TaxID=1391653 RepID=A0A0K1P9G4_9BACT|nr:hydrogenase maturation protease [Vulgatibacter incomptus]AKU90152.1 Hydrogenase maturation protease [Vulgatibacter incomptus]
MSARVLVAGIGNIFLGDDGFGVVAARRLAEDDLPAGVEVEDYGIRCLHLAFALLEPPELLIVLDAAGRGGPPGSLYVIEPILDAPTQASDAHSASLATVFSSVRAMGGSLPPVRVVGCEPASLDEGIGLSAQVEGAVEPALALVRNILDERAGGGKG